jgi:hypothetical protein
MLHIIPTPYRLGGILHLQAPKPFIKNERDQVGEDDPFL